MWFIIVFWVYRKKLSSSLSKFYVNPQKWLLQLVWFWQELLSPPAAVIQGGKTLHDLMAPLTPISGCPALALVFLYLTSFFFFFFFGDWFSLSLCLSTIEGSPWDCIGLWHYHCFTPSSPHVPSLYTLYIHVLVYQHQGPDSACGDCFLDMTCTCNQGCCTANPGPAGYACLPNSYVAIRMGQPTLVNKNKIEKLMAW